MGRPLLPKTPGLEAPPRPLVARPLVELLVPGHELVQATFDGGRGLVAEELVGLGDVRVGLLDLGVRGLVLEFCLDAQALLDLLEDVACACISIEDEGDRDAFDVDTERNRASRAWNYLD